MAEFFCRADANSVFWTVNGITVIQLNDSRITEHDGEIVDELRTQILRIISTTKYNNSIIQCHSFSSGEDVMESEPVILRVQGTFKLLYTCLLSSYIMIMQPS